MKVQIKFKEQIHYLDYIGRKELPLILEADFIEIPPQTRTLKIRHMTQFVSIPFTQFYITTYLYYDPYDNMIHPIVLISNTIYSFKAGSPRRPIFPNCDLLFSDNYMNVPNAICWGSTEITDVVSSFWNSTFSALPHNRMDMEAPFEVIWK